MSVNLCSGIELTSERPKLQAIKDFAAAEVCFSDGANPLSFHVGEIFTFLQELDANWVKVEREIWKNDPLLKIGDYPATERGIVPLDYVAAMNAVPEKAEKTGSYGLSTADENNENILQVSSWEPPCLLTICEASE